MIGGSFVIVAAGVGIIFPELLTVMQVLDVVLLVATLIWAGVRADHAARATAES